MTAISQDLQFFENQSSYTNKGDLYNTGNTMLDAIKTFRDELEAQKVAANTTVATTTTSYTNMFTNLSSALTQNNTISSLNNLSVDEGLYNDKVNIFGNAKGVSLNDFRASYTGYFYVRFNKNIPTTTLETGFTYNNGILTITPVSLTIPITSEINHLYVERTASILGVWLNGILVSINNVTVYKMVAFTPPATHSFSIYADQVRTFSSALTVTEIARLLYQFANNFTPEPLYAGSTMPYTVSSGNPIYTNFNTSALGFDKTVIVKPALTLETGEFINTSTTQIDFNVNVNTNISVCLVVGLGNFNSSTTTVTLTPRVTTPNTTIVLNSSNATEWNDGYSVSASSTYAGISSATAVSTLTTYPISPLTTTTKLVSPNITATNPTVLKVKVGGVVTDIPANSPFTNASITPSLSYTGTTYYNPNTVVFNGTSTVIDLGISQTVLKDLDYYLELELNPTVWDTYRGVFGDHTGTPNGIVGFQNGSDLAYYQSASTVILNTAPATLFPVNTWSKFRFEQKVINSTQVMLSIFVNDVLVNRGFGNKLIPSGGNLIVGRAYNSADRYFLGSMRNIKFVQKTSSYTSIVTGGQYVDSYSSGVYTWGLYLTSTVATIVRKNHNDLALPTTYQLPLFYSDYRLSFVSDTEMYVVSASKQYLFNGSSFTAITSGATSTTANIDILGAGTGLTLYTFDNTLNNVNANYPLSTTTAVTYAAMKFGNGAKTSGYGAYMSCALTYTGATRVYSFWVKWSVVTNYYNFCFGGNNQNTAGSSGYSWFINATNGYLANVSSTYTSCPVVANQLYHIVIEANHSTGAYSIYMDKVLKQSGVDSIFTRTRLTNNYQFFSFNDTTFAYGVPPTMDQFRIINLGRALTQADVNILYDEVIPAPTLTAPFVVAGNKVVETNTGKTYSISGGSLNAGSTLAVGTNTFSFARKSYGMTWEALNLKGKLYNLTNGSLLTTVTDVTNSYGTVYSDYLQVANLLSDRSIRKYVLYNNLYGGEIAMNGILPVGSLLLVGYWYGGHLKTDVMTETRDICAVQTATQTILYYNDGSNWISFFTINALVSFSDTDNRIITAEFNTAYGSYNGAGLTVSLASIPTGNAVVTNSGLAIGLATSNTTTIPTSFESQTATSSVFNFDTATVTDSYGSWLSAVNGNFLHTKLTGALANLTSLTLNTVK